MKCQALSIASAMVISLPSFLLWAQSPSVATSRFEVVSVKPSVSGIARTPMKVESGRVIYNSFSPKLLLQVAYKQPDWGIVGGPKWLDSDQYDIVATIPSNTSADQIPSMLQLLLAERFHLETRHERREVPVYQLVVAKKGPKLQSADSDEQWTGGSMKGGIFRGSIELYQVTMGGLADVLASKTGRPVLDNTHLAGPFHVNLKWTPDDTSVNNSDKNSVSLYTALQEQLGLKLESAKAPVEVLVVTRMEKPSIN